MVQLNDENHGAGGQHQCFSYNDLNRLQGAFTSDDCASGYNGSVGTGVYEFWYEYNSIGSLTKLRDTESGSVLADWDYGDTSVGAGAYAADDWNPDPGAAVAIGYDESGNMISRGGDTLIWDADNRLHSYDQDTGTDTSFVYDADGNRVLRIHGSTTTTYLGDLYESDGTTTRTYYTFNTDTVGYREHTTSSDKRFYVTGDHLDSTATVIDATDVGNPVDQYYYPYGEPRTTWTIDIDRAYTGQTSDHTETGLYHYNARYYDPQISRFISSDTIVPDPANPQTLNRYSYVGNNPVNYTDPSGHRAILNRDGCSTSSGCIESSFWLTGGAVYTQRKAEVGGPVIGEYIFGFVERRPLTVNVDATLCLGYCLGVYAQHTFGPNGAGEAGVTSGIFGLGASLDVGIRTAVADEMETRGEDSVEGLTIEGGTGLGGGYIERGARNTSTPENPSYWWGYGIAIGGGFQIGPTVSVPFRQWD